MSPKLLFSMIAEWVDLIDYRVIIQDFVSRGGELPKRVKPHDKKEVAIGYVHIDCF